MKSKKEWMPEIIVGDRIILRPMEISDAFDVCASLQDNLVSEKLSHFSFFQRIPSLEDERTYLRRMIDSEADLLMAIELKHEHRFIGTIGLHELDFWNENCRFGIIIFNSVFWGQGYAKEAESLILRFVFCVLKMNKVYLTPRLDNSQAIEIYKKLGFRPEGILREEYKVKEGQHLDLLRMSILKREWEMS